MERDSVKYIQGAPEFVDGCDCSDCIFQKQYFADTPEGAEIRASSEKQNEVWEKAKNSSGRV